MKRIGRRGFKYLLPFIGGLANSYTYGTFETMVILSSGMLFVSSHKAV
jgi:hypothetical protein